MNGLGFFRALMAIGMDTEDFFIKVMDAISEEFNEEAIVIEILDGFYYISLMDYSLMITIDEIDLLKDPEDPYELDRYILNEFSDQGLELDIWNSDYLEEIYSHIELS